MLRSFCWKSQGLCAELLAIAPRSRKGRSSLDGVKTTVEVKLSLKELFAREPCTAERVATSCLHRGRFPVHGPPWKWRPCMNWTRSELQASTCDTRKLAVAASLHTSMLAEAHMLSDTRAHAHTLQIPVCLHLWD